MSSYIMDLRKVVGHRPLLQIGASVIVEDACPYKLAANSAKFKRTFS